jgi:urease subunit beta
MREEYVKPGEYLLDETAGEIELNGGRKTANVLVEHRGDRPVQVGSHFHFFEVNQALNFDRSIAYGMRLNIPAGTAVRFEPGEEREVSLVEFGGLRRIYGHTGKVNGPL